MKNVWILTIFFYVTVIRFNGECALTKQQIQNMSPQDRPSCQQGAKIPISRVDTTQRLEDLRSHFQSKGINGYIIPSVDAHQSEYVSDYDKRRQFISGFSGSQGTAVVLGDKAALWTDARYFLQADDEIDCNWILMKLRTNTAPTITEWLIANRGDTAGVIGAYPFFVSSDEWLIKSKELERSNMKLIRIEDEMIDMIWTTGRPPQPSTDIHGLSIKFTGQHWSDKLINVYTEMERKDVDALVVTSLDEVAWLVNSRAEDIPYNPVFMSYAIVNRKTNKTSLYIREKNRKLVAPPDLQMTDVPLYQHLNTDRDGSCSGRNTNDTMCIEVLDYTSILTDVRRFNSTVDRVWISYTCSYALYGVINRAKIYQANTPIMLMKAIKNPVEQSGLRNSHIRDGVALIKFIAHLEKEVHEGKTWTEMSASISLESYRREQKYNKGLSFKAISSSGYHAAMNHYTPTNTTDKKLTTTEIYLLDSGGQYLDGTTDVTRTFHFGTPSDFEKECYTRVLMAQIELTNFVFINGLKGREFDAIARRPLWKVGLQYRHGTGHGVGSFLSVHEGPGSISLTAGKDPTYAEIHKNMFSSIEPGYYEDGHFGVRHENVAQIIEADTKYHFPGYTFLTFDTVTMVPHEPNLIDYSLLKNSHVDWLNSYHKKVQDTIGPLVKDDGIASKWLSSRTGQVVNGHSCSKGSSIFATIFFILVYCVL